MLRRHKANDYRQKYRYWGGKSTQKHRKSGKFYAAWPSTGFSKQLHEVFTCGQVTGRKRGPVDSGVDLICP